MSVDRQPVTLAGFIDWEQRQPRRYEFRDGLVSAMAGASDDHNQIVANLMAIIRPALRGGTCRVYANDMMLVTDYPGSRYPDVLVTCDARDAQQRLQKRHPKLIVEVLSEATAGVDSSDKLDEYQTIAALEEYVLIDSRKPSVRIYRRRLETLETGPALVSGALEIVSLGLVVPVSEIYEDVDFSRDRSLTP